LVNEHDAKQRPAREVTEHDAKQRPAREVTEHDAKQRSAREVTAAQAFSPPRPVRTRERRRVKLAATLAVLVLAVLGFASYKFIANAGHAQHPAAAAHPRVKVPAVPVRAASALPSPATASPASASSAPASSAPASAASSAAATTAPPPRVLTAASVVAFGPAGPADGDNPQNAARALSGNSATPWLSDWYATPDFYDMPPGTGLLLDMGHTVTISSVQVSIAGHGSDLQLRAGSKPELAWLPQVASAANAGGVVQLQPNAPVQVRYVLIWFTHLPPDSAGTYQASVYRIVVQGQP
jgi:hypothetical protein